MQMRIGLAGLLVSIALTGCGMFDSRDESVRAERDAQRKLEVPPDLSRPSGDSAYATAGGSVTASGQTRAVTTESSLLPPAPKVRVERAGSQRWLVVDGDPEKVWRSAKAFFTKNQMPIKREDMAAGILETDWMEAKETIQQGGFQRMLARAGVTSTGLRDKYRIRLERGAAAGTTELYLTHRGLEEIGRCDSTSGIQSAWQPRRPDPDHEAEMLRQLMVFLGHSAAAAKQMVNGAAAELATLRKDGKQVSVLINDGLNQSWRRVGLTLDRVGFTVEDRDLSKGVFYVQYNDPDKEGKKSSWFSSDKSDPGANRYQVRLTAVEGGTQVQVHDVDGKLLADRTAARILTLLHEQLK